MTVLVVQSLDEMNDGEADVGDLSELSCAPVLGLKVTDYDCCSTESWVVVGPSLGDTPTLLVEAIEAHWNGPYGPPTWGVVETLPAPTLADAVAAAIELATDPHLGRVACRCGD